MRAIFVAAIAVLLLYGPSKSLAYESCEECHRDHKSVCEGECPPGDDHGSCLKECARSKCGEYCGAKKGSKCNVCRNQAVDSCPRKCQGKLAKDASFEARRACASACIQDSCQKPCSKEDLPLGKEQKTPKGKKREGKKD
ncbi:MAG: hypothetical protein KDD70_09305 [Bdellovibrionales bacterium]|nr:hypothetical protein [Bdellovibrionales bacterium]